MSMGNITAASPNVSNSSDESNTCEQASSAPLQVLKTVEACRTFRKTHAQQKLVLVPTMGALHAGHEALIRKAKACGDVVMVSVFVNPTQFGPNEDFDAYPRALSDDVATCEGLGVDAVFAPSADVIYPHGYQDEDGLPLYTQVKPAPLLEKQLCGLSRPHFFTGVCSVVLRLFTITQCNAAVFGEKDAQQLAIVRRMIQDFALPVELIPHPIVREENGLAMSSRNRYFSTPEEREAALILSKTLVSIQALLNERLEGQSAGLASGAMVLGDIDMLDVFHRHLAQLSSEAAELVKLDYLSMVNDDTFEPLTEYPTEYLKEEHELEDEREHVRVLMAAYVGDVRLIDNLYLVRES